MPGAMPAVEKNYWRLPSGPAWAWWILAILPLDTQAQVKTICLIFYLCQTFVWTYFLRTIQYAIMNNYFSNKFWAKSSWRNGSRQLVEFWDSSWEEIPTCDHQHQCEKVLVSYLWIRTFKEEQEDRIHHCPDRNAFGPWLRGWIGQFWGRRKDWRFCDLDHFKPWTLNHWQLFLMTWASKEGFSDLCDDPTEAQLPTFTYSSSPTIKVHFATKCIVTLNHILVTVSEKFVVSINFPHWGGISYFF